MKLNLARRFLKESRYFERRYQNFDQDLKKFFADLKIGRVKSDRVQGFKIPIYKARMRNSSANSGKSGGFRIIYYSISKDGVYLLAIYSKNQKEDISKKEILHILKEEKLM